MNIVFESFEDLREFAYGTSGDGRVYTDPKGRKYDNDTLGARYARRGALTGLGLNAALKAVVAGMTKGESLALMRRMPGRTAAGIAADTGVGAGLGYLIGKAAQNKRRQEALLRRRD